MPACPGRGFPPAPVWPSDNAGPVPPSRIGRTNCARQPGLGRRSSGCDTKSAAATTLRIGLGTLSLAPPAKSFANQFPRPAPALATRFRRKPVLLWLYLGRIALSPAVQSSAATRRLNSSASPLLAFSWQSRRLGRNQRLSAPRFQPAQIFLRADTVAPDQNTPPVRLAQPEAETFPRCQIFAATNKSGPARSAPPHDPEQMSGPF